MKKIGYFAMFFLPFCWSLITYGPNIVFYFDQIDGQANIIRIVDNKIYLDYYHEKKKEVMRFTHKEDNLKKIKKIREKDVWDIKYSQHFPDRVYLVGITNRPGLPSLILILIFLLPLLLFKRVMDG